MSYARRGRWSDVYVFDSVQGDTVCLCGTIDPPRQSFHAKDHAEMIDHLIYQHALVGDRVRRETIDALAEDLNEDDPGLRHPPISAPKTIDCQRCGAILALAGPVAIVGLCCKCSPTGYTTLKPALQE